MAEAAVDLHPPGDPLLPFGKVAPKTAHAGCSSAVISLLIGEEVDLVTSRTTNMFIGTRIPWPNVELIGKLACCVLFKMWIERSLPTRILLCPPRLVVPCLCTATMPIGRDVALMPSWFSLSAFGFGPGEGAEVELESVTDTNILLWPPQRQGRWPWNHSVT